MYIFYCIIFLKSSKCNRLAIDSTYFAFSAHVSNRHKITKIQSRRFDFLDFAFSGHVFHVDKLCYTLFKNRCIGYNHVGHVADYLHMKGSFYSENNRCVFDICSKVTFFQISNFIFDFWKLHKVFMRVFFIFDLWIEKSWKMCFRP
jgi:hypothetical protein